MWSENSWCAQDFIEVLELLSGSLFICVCDRLVINVCHVGEPVHDKCPHHASLSDFVLINVNCGQAG